MFRSSQIVHVSVLVGVLTAGLAGGSAPAVAQEGVQETARFTLPWQLGHRVPPYVPEDFLRNAEMLGLAADVEHTVTVRFGTTTLTLAPASGAAAAGSQSLGLLQIEAPDNASLSGAYQMRLVTPPPVRNSRFARLAPPASTLQLVRADGSVLASTQVTNAAAYQQMAAEMMPAVHTADTTVWRDSKPARQPFPWKEFFKAIVDIVTVLVPLLL